MVYRHLQEMRETARHHQTPLYTRPGNAVVEPVGDQLLKLFGLLQQMHFLQLVRSGLRMGTYGTFSRCSHLPGYPWDTKYHRIAEIYSGR